ncbi:MAG: BREX system P-loop protein BrxC, partial [Bacteroidetes bacterium]
ISYLEQKYTNPNSDEGKILLSFSSQKAEKENRIKTLVEKVLTNGDLIYLFNVNKLTEDQAVSLIQSQQKEMLKNVYTKRLQSQLSDELAKAIIKEVNNSRLHTYFHGEDFAFFDKQGNFIGEKLKVSEDILYKIRNTFVDGKTLEMELEQPPTGFSLGTVMTTLAVLMRAGRVIAKYNGKELFSWRDEGVINIFSAAREFRKAAFKAVSKSLSLQQKQEIVQFLLDIEADKHLGLKKKIDFNTNDFELANAIRELVKHFADKIDTLAKIEKGFDTLFPNAAAGKDFLEEFTGPVSEANYIDRATGFLEQKQKFSDAVKRILNIEKFIRNRLPYVKQW